MIVQQLFYSIRKLPQQKPFQGRMRSILVIAAAERRFFIGYCTYTQMYQTFCFGKIFPVYFSSVNSKPMPKKPQQIISPMPTVMT